MFKYLAPVALVLLTGCPSAPPLAEPCKGVSCGSNGHCVVDGTLPACLCDDGFKADKLSCVAIAPVDRCQPNPCVAANQTTCGVVDGGAVCACNAGYLPADGGCGMDVAPSCADQHAGDPFEPDECPALAQSIVANDSDLTGHTIEGMGDVDWLRLTTQKNHVYRVAASSTGVMALTVDIYSADGVTVLGFDHFGVASPLAQFKAPDEVALIRIRATRLSDAGIYTLKVTDLGLDDYVDSAELAAPAAIGGKFEGALQFAGDVDVVKLSLVGGRKYGLGFEESPFTLELIAADQTTVVRREVGSIITLRPMGGTFYLRVSGGPTSLVGDYHYDLIDYGPDDNGDVPGEAKLILPSNMERDFKFEASRDTDVFAFDAVAGHFYSFICTPFPSSGCNLMVTDKDGARLSKIIPNYVQKLTYKALNTERVYLRLSWPIIPAMVNYTLRFEDFGPDDYGDDFGKAGVAGVGAGTAFRLEADGDVDVFSVVTVATHIYRITCTGNSACYPRVFTPALLELTYQSGSGAFEWESVNGGNHFVVIDTPTQAGSYTLQVEDLGLDDTGDTTSTAKPIAPLATPTTGTLEDPSDVDVFSFTATAPNVYRFTCVFPNNVGCSSVLKDAFGTVLSSGNNYLKLVSVEAATSGIYFVEVSKGNGPIGAYAWQLENRGPDDHGDDRASATAISPGPAAAAGALETYDDIDTFLFTAVAGRVYRFTCTSVDTACQMKIRDSAQMLVGAFTGSGFAGVKAATAGVYLVEVSSGSINYWAGGTYSVVLEDLGSDDHGDTVITATSVTPPVLLENGQLEIPGDVDVLAFTALAKHIYRFNVAGVGASLTIDLKDSNGTLITSAMGQVEFKAQATGTMFLSYFSSQTVPPVPYTWSLLDLAIDDHGDDPATATGLMLGVAKTGKIETYDDVDYFSVPLTAGTFVSIAPSTVYIQSFDPMGGVLGGESPSPPSFTAASTGVYFFRVRAPFGGFPVSYSLFVQ